MLKSIILCIFILLLIQNYKIKIKCDFCDYTRELSYKEYIRNTKKDGKYYCSECSPIKVKKTCLERYNVNSGFKTTPKNHIFNLYGVDNVFQLENVKIKCKKTKLERYGNENYVNIEKHIETIIKLYGVDNISKSDIIKERKIETCLKNWGVKHPSQNKEICAKMKASISRNRTYDLSNMLIYRYKVIQLTLKCKKELLEKWNGFDYYDNEYIADNFNLKSSHKNYPTIDHKLSVFYCFINNISIEDASSIENLCITKKGINSRKSRKNEDEFKQNQ